MVLTIFNLWKSLWLFSHSKLPFMFSFTINLWFSTFRSVLLSWLIALSFPCFSHYHSSLVDALHQYSTLLLACLRYAFSTHLLYTLAHHIVSVNLQMYHLASSSASQWCSFSYPWFSPGSILVPRVHFAPLFCQHRWQHGWDLRLIVGQSRLSILLGRECALADIPNDSTEYAVWPWRSTSSFQEPHHLPLMPPLVQLSTLGYAQAQHIQSVFIELLVFIQYINYQQSTNTAFPWNLICL